jgi:RHH-type proline utilization regulon transcriptional repressor/proline dehydrogenase/delta 1-pyrroline-5-carboxylate dehydrogenase
MNSFRNAIRESAGMLRKAANAGRTNSEQKADLEQQRLVEDPEGLKTFMAMFDEALRAVDNQGIADMAKGILKENGIPKFLKEHEKMLFEVFGFVAPLVPNISVPIFIAGLKSRANKVVAVGDNYSSRIKGDENLEFNLNTLGEMIFGRAEVEEKTSADLKLLKDKKVSCISVKASNMYSQVNPLGFDHSVECIKTQLRPRIRAAVKNKPSNESGRVHKLINLDMEEYSDLDITLKVFKDVLMEPEFMGYQMGIAIQTYMPDAERVITELLDFARERVSRGGAKIRVRVVKGANIPLEAVKASENGWKTPTYKEKVDTDANWKKIVSILLKKENLAVCEVGIASHNDFDLAYANQLLVDKRINSGAEFEVLEGMANSLRRELINKFKRKVLVYFPVVKSVNFLTAMAYLVRRFQEQSSEQNFLRYVFNLEVDSAEHKKLHKQFTDSLDRIKRVSSIPRNTQDRSLEAKNTKVNPLSLDRAKFKGDPRTNFSLVQNRDWIKECMDKYKDDLDIKVPVMVGAGTVKEDRELDEVYDRFDIDKQIGEVAVPTNEDIGGMCRVARESSVVRCWAAIENEAKFEIFAKAKALINQRRGDLIGLMAAEAGKTVAEAEGEVCELIDFIEVYATGLKEAEEFENTEIVKEASVVGVISPFNFPLAILGGGVVAALLAGNAVIAKPSPKTRLIAKMLIDILHESGVPKDVLQLCNARDYDVQTLVENLDQCIFTGSTEIAFKIRKMNPKMELFAETGGKNVMYVSEYADKELAIKNIVATFGHNAQKCSATSIVALPPKLYKDKKFLAQLTDAVKSLEIGDPKELHTKVGPLISSLNSRLRAAVDRPDVKGWLVKPEKQNGRDDMISPGLYIGTDRKDAARIPEYFGPIIDIVCVEDVKDYANLVAETGSGLVAGIQSLKKSELEYFNENVQAGVLYANDKMVGAEAGRNGFGGFANSRVGRGRQAGWFNYIQNFIKFKNVISEDVVIDSEAFDGSSQKMDERARNIAIFLNELSSDELESLLPSTSVLECAVNNYLVVNRDCYAVETECPDKVLGKKIVNRFRPLGKVAIIADSKKFESVVLSVVASYLAGNEIDLYLDYSVYSEIELELIIRLEELLGLKVIPSKNRPKFECSDYKMLRIFDTEFAEDIRNNLAYTKLNTQIECGEASYAPRVEMGKHLQEQSYSETYHRHGDGLKESDKKVIAKL